MQTTGATYEEWSKDPKLCAESIIKATDEIGVNCICTLVDLSVEAADWGQKVVYSVKNAAHPDMDDRVLKSADDYDKVEIINPRETPRMSEHIELARLLYEARGQEQMFYDMIKSPDKMNQALHNMTERGISTVRSATERRASTREAAPGNILEADGQTVRLSRVKDLKLLTKVAQSLPHINFISSSIVCEEAPGELGSHFLYTNTICTFLQFVRYTMEA